MDKWKLKEVEVVTDSLTVKVFRELCGLGKMLARRRLTVVWEICVEYKMTANHQDVHRLWVECGGQFGLAICCTDVSGEFVVHQVQEWNDLRVDLFGGD